MAYDNVPAPSSPSPSIDKLGKDNWQGGVPKGQTPQEALADKHTTKPVDPSSLK